MADTNYYFLLLHAVSLNISYSPDGQDSDGLKFHFSLRGRGFLDGEFYTENPNFQHHAAQACVIQSLVSSILIRE